MRNRSTNLNARQLAWCQKTMPAFAKAYADVVRRDAEVAKNRAQFERAGEAAEYEGWTPRVIDGAAGDAARAG